MNRAGIRVFLVACAVLLVGLGAFNVRPTSAQEGEEKFVYATVYVCDEHLSTIEEMETECGTLSGASLYFRTHDGTEYGTCTTEDGRCGFDLPIDQTVTISLYADAPEGYYLEAPNYRTRNVIDLGDDSVLGMPVFVFYPVSDYDGQTTGMAASAAYCDETPGNGVSYLDVCHAAPDLRIEFTDEAGNFVAECFTLAGKIEGGSEAGVCGIQVPYGSTTTATLDLSTVAPGYTLISEQSQQFTAPSTPPDGIQSFPHFVLVADQEATEIPDDSAGGSGADTTTEEPPAEIEGRTVAIYEGDCDALGAEVATLNDVLPEVGDAVGDKKAISAELSRTIGSAFFLDQAIDEGYALVVYEDETTDTPIVCGDIGGVNTHDGMLPIGLGEVDKSGFVGTAVLSYNDTDELTTDVTIVISEELLPEPTGTPSN